MVVIGHSACQLKMGTISLKTVFHENSALREQVQRGIDRCPGDPVTPSVHVQIELVSTEMPVELSDPVDHIIPFLGVPVLLAFEEFGELILESFDVLN